MPAQSRVGHTKENNAMLINHDPELDSLIPNSPETVRSDGIRGGNIPCLSTGHLGQLPPGEGGLRPLNAIVPSEPGWVAMSGRAAYLIACSAAPLVKRGATPQVAIDAAFECFYAARDPLLPLLDRPLMWANYAGESHFHITPSKGWAVVTDYANADQSSAYHVRTEREALDDLRKIAKREGYLRGPYCADITARGCLPSYVEALPVAALYAREGVDVLTQ